MEFIQQDSCLSCLFSAIIMIMSIKKCWESSRSVKAGGKKVVNVLFEQVALYMFVAKKASDLV